MELYEAIYKRRTVREFLDKEVDFEAMRVMDMTQGNPIKLILAFAVPLFIGNIFQQIYSMVAFRMCADLRLWQRSGASDHRHIRHGGHP